MKCSLSGCPETQHLPVMRTNSSKGTEHHFCSDAHEVAWLVDELAQQATGMFKAVFLTLQTAEGRKMLANFVADKLL